MLLLIAGCAASDYAPGSPIGVSTGELRSHDTAYCDGPLTIGVVRPAEVLSVWFCESFDPASRCAMDPDASVYQVGDVLTIECPPAYQNTGHALIYFLLTE